MKNLVLFSLCLLIGFGAQAQTAAKGFKALDASDYAGAKSNFEGALLLDANDPAANFGMSRYHGIAATGEKDNEKALEYLVAAEENYPTDPKAQDKLGKYGMDKAEMVTRRDLIERSFLEDAKELNTVEAFDTFLKRFPDSKMATAATNHRNKVAYDLALKVGSVDALDQFIAAYPEADEVKAAAPLRDKMASEAALKTNTEEAYQHFIKSYPEAIQAPQIQQRLNAVAFENAKAANTAQAFRDYIDNYPDSVFLEQAKQKLEWLETRGGN